MQWLAANQSAEKLYIVFKISGLQIIDSSTLKQLKEIVATF